MTTMVYTHVEYEWDGVAEQYVVKEKQGYEYEGPIILMKKAFKGVLGTVLKVVATIALSYFLGPAGAGLFNSAWAAGAASGAIMGGITGGVKGALMGGVLGGVGGYLGGGGLGYEQGFYGAGQSGLSMGTDAMGNAIMGPSSSLASEAVQGSLAQGAVQGAAEVGGTVTGTGGDIGFDNLTADAASQGGVPSSTFEGAAAQSGQVGSLNGAEAAGQSAAPQAGMNPQGNYDFSNPNPGGQVYEAGGQSIPADRAFGNNPLLQNAGVSAPFSPSPDLVGANGGYNGGGLWVNVDSSGASGEQAADKQKQGFDFKSAGLQVGKQLLGSALGDATEPSYMKDYAKMMEKNNEASQRTTDYNMSMANKKAAVGDQLYGDAMAMSPDYYAEQQRRARQNQDSSAWGDAEQRMRAQGKDDNYINNERRRYDIATSQNQGTAYDSGWQAGMNSRNSTFGTAGGMYGQVGYPQDTVGSGYSQMNQMNQNRQQTIGRGIDAVWGAGTGGNKTGTEKTRDKDPNMGVSGGSIWGQ